MTLLQVQSATLFYDRVKFGGETVALLHGRVHSGVCFDAKLTCVSRD